MSATATQAPARSLPEICAEARRTHCGHCWEYPGRPCVTNPGTGVDGLHIARFARAYRRGLISREDFAAAFVDGGAVASTSEMAVLDLAVALGENRYRLSIMGAAHSRWIATAVARAVGVTR